MKYRLGGIWRGLLIIVVQCTVLQVSSSTVPTWGQEQIPTVHELEKHVTAYRRERFKSGYVLLNLVSTSRSKQQTECEYDITFDGDQLRVDLQMRILGSNVWGPMQKFVVNEDSYIQDLGSNTAITIGRATIDSSEHYNGIVFHPRALGMTVNGTAGMVHEGFDVLFGRTDRDVPTVSRDHVNGLETWRIDYRHKEGTQFSIWLAPDQGHSVVRAESRRDLPNGRIVQFVVNELQEYPNGGVWYPRVSRQELSINGQWEDRETYTVKEAIFGIAVNPAQFKLAGMALAPGRSVADSTESGSPVGYVWNGQKTTPMLATKPPLRRRSVAATSLNSSFFLIANAVLCVVLASILVVRMLRYRNGT